MKRKEKRPLRAVIDTNVLVSGLFSESGSIAELMDLWTDEAFELVTSEEIIEELYRTLHKPSVQKHFEPKENEITEYIEVLRERAILTPGLHKTDRIKDDPTDNKFLSAAIEAKADFIVSGDRHLKDVEVFHGVKITNAKGFVERVRKG